jgi:hypothetical protein
MKIGQLGLLIILAFGCKPTEQTYKDSINKTFDIFINSKNLGDYKTLTSLMPSEFFEIYSKDSVISWLTRAEQQNGFTRINNLKIIDYGQFLHDNDKIYSKLKYEATIVNESNEPYSDFLFKYLQKEFGDNNVKFDSTSNSYLIKNMSYTIAFGEQDGQTWKYLEYNPQTGEKIMSLIIPPDVWTKLK